MLSGLWRNPAVEAVTVKWNEDLMLSLSLILLLIKNFAVLVMRAALLKAVKVRSAVLNRE